MITSLANAKSLLGISDTSQDAKISDKLRALEVTVRNYTRNKFHDARIRSYNSLTFDAETKTITGDNFLTLGFRAGDTIDIDECLLNIGVFTVTASTSTTLTVSEALVDEEAQSSIVTKMVYPYDVIEGVIKLIDYDLRMSDKIGIKQESIARHSVTYYDQNATESTEGYPAALMKFLAKYKRLRWS